MFLHLCQKRIPSLSKLNFPAASWALVPIQFNSIQKKTYQESGHFFLGSSWSHSSFCSFLDSSPSHSALLTRTSFAQTKERSKNSGHNWPPAYLNGSCLFYSSRSNNRLVPACRLTDLLSSNSQRKRLLYCSNPNWLFFPLLLPSATSPPSAHTLLFSSSHLPSPISVVILRSPSKRNLTAKSILNSVLSPNAKFRRLWQI